MDSLYTVLIVVAGVAAHVLFAVMFVLRVTHPTHAHRWGLAGTAAVVPLSVAVGVAVARQLGVWAIALPIPFIVFSAVEWLVDEVLDFEVRQSRWLGPYLLLFYLGSWGLIGAGFLAAPVGGALVLVAYFVCLGATAWSYRRIGHGQVHLPS